MSVIAFAFVPVLYLMPDIRFDAESAEEYNAGWKASCEHSQWDAVTLPAKLDVPKGDTLVLENTLPAEYVEGRTMCIRTSMQGVEVLADGKLLYERGMNDSEFPGNCFGSSWNIIRLPDQYSGKQIIVRLYSPYQTYAGMVNSILMGSKSACFFSIVRQYGPGFLASALIFLAGIVAFVIYILSKARRYHNEKFLYLSLFAFLISLWLMGESKMLQFFMGNAYFITKISYIAQLLYPIPFLSFLDASVNYHRRSKIPVLIGLFIANFFVTVLLDMFGVMDLFESLISVHILIIVSLIYILCVLLDESIRFRSRAARIQLVSVAVLTVFGVIELVNFYLSHMMNISVFVRVGVLFYIIFLGASSVLEMKKLTVLTAERDYYQELAFADLLTGANNRTAYEQDIEKYKKSKTVCIIQIDLNNMKQINDKFGHHTGDIAIQKAYGCIDRAFGKMGPCYRVGGDEFVCLLPNADPERVERAIEEANTYAAEVDSSAEYDFSFAIGYACYTAGGEQDIKEAAKQADAGMYEQKKAMKSRS